MLLHRLTTDLYGCNAEVCSASVVEQTLQNALEAAEFKILGRTLVNFQPHGATAVFVLAESHAVISTWPEVLFASLDLALCAKAERGESVIEAMNKLLMPKSIVTKRSISQPDFQLNKTPEQDADMRNVR